MSVNGIDPVSHESASVTAQDEFAGMLEDSSAIEANGAASSNNDPHTNDTVKTQKVGKFTYLDRNTSDEQIAQIMTRLIGELSETDRALLAKLVAMEIRKPVNPADVQKVLFAILWRCIAPSGGEVYGKTREDGTRSILTVILNPFQFSPLNGKRTLKRAYVASDEQARQGLVDKLGDRRMRNAKLSVVDFKTIDSVLTQIQNGELGDTTNRATHYYAYRAVSPGWGERRKVNDGDVVEAGGHRYLNYVNDAKGAKKGEGEIPREWAGWSGALRQQTASRNLKIEETEKATTVIAAAEILIIPPESTIQENLRMPEMAPTRSAPAVEGMRQAPQTSQNQELDLDQWSPRNPFMQNLP